MADYLTSLDLRTIHADQIARYGGQPGIRDNGLLDAALYRPQTGAYADLRAEAAALGESIALFQPFVDGNQRTAFAAMHTFLQINGIDFTATPEAIWTFIQAANASGCPRIRNYRLWRCNSYHP